MTPKMGMFVRQADPFILNSYLIRSKHQGFVIEIYSIIENCWLTKIQLKRVSLYCGISIGRILLSFTPVLVEVNIGSLVNLFH